MSSSPDGLHDEARETLTVMVNGLLAMRGLLRALCLPASGVLVLATAGCGSFNPQPLENVAFKERAETKTEGPLRVTAAVLSAEECEQAFDLDLYDDGIQPIWLEIANSSAEDHWFVRVGLDPDYFAPLEVAYINHYSFSGDANEQMDRYLYEHGMGNYIPSGSTRSGFLFTNLDEGTKSFNVDVIGGDNEITTFTFFIQVPGLRIDHREADIDSPGTCTMTAFSRSGWKSRIAAPRTIGL